MDDWVRLLQGALFIGFVVSSTFVGITRGQVKELKERVEGLRGDRDDEKARVAARDLELAEERETHTKERAEDQKEIARLSEAVEVLRSTVTGETHLVALEGAVADMAEALGTHHTEAMGGVTRLEDAIVRVEQALMKMRAS